MIIKRAYSEGLELPEILEPGTKVATYATPSAARSYIAGLEPDPLYTYVLVNAMGYSEYYGANSNTDWYGYNPNLDFNGLLHAWDGIGQDHETDRMKGKAWTYGYPCFYNATCFAHHRNTDPQQLGFGDVVFVAPNSHMKRVELVMRVFNEEAKKKGHTNFLDRLRAGERVDVSMGAKVPFDLCVRPDTLVRSEDGWVPAESIRVGDSVLTHKGRLRKVTRTFRRQAEDALLCVRAKGVPALEVTGTHPMLVVRQEQLRKCLGSAKGRRRRCTPSSGVCTFCGNEVSLEPQWVDAKDLRVGDYLVAPREELGAVQVDPKRARLLGYWLGDGHRVRRRTGKKKNGPHRLMGYAFTVGHLEEAHLVRLWDCVRDVSANEPRIHESGEGRAAYQVVVYDQETAQWLCHAGADAEYNKRVNEKVFSWKRESLLELLGGWIDTDGSFDHDKGLVRISTVSRGLALDCQRILRLLGVPATITTAKQAGGYVPTKEYHYSVAITKHHIHRLALWERAEKVGVVEACAQGTEVLVVGDAVLHPVFALRQSTYEGDVVNFSVEEDESYVAEGVSTHNCSVCTDWDAVKTAWKTFDAKKHAHPGIAILLYHKAVKPIRGLAVTKADYCVHMREQRGKILPTGQKVFVYNDFPRFFDISFVWIGADRTARAMWFLGPEGSTPTPRERPALDLTALLSSLLRSKTAAMLKDIEGGHVVEAVGSDAECSPTMGTEALVGMSRLFGPKSVMSTLAGLGIVLKPQEFQTVTLAALPQGPEMVKRLAEKSLVFDAHRPQIDNEFAVSADDFLPELAEKSAVLMASRSGFAPYLSDRLENKVAGLYPTPKLKVASGDVLDDLAAKYNGYRLSVLEKSAELFPLAGSADIALLTEKTANWSRLLLGLGPVIHFVSSHFRQKAEEGKQLGAVGKFVADNPTFTTMATVGAALRAVMGVQKAGGLGAAAKTLLSAATKLIK
jgi:intein/homing endonuclease